MVVGLFPALVLLDGTVGLIWNVLSPVIVSVPAICTTLSSSAFRYTCASVAGFVGLFPAAVDLLGNTGSAWYVLIHVIVSAPALCTTLSSSAFKYT